MRSIRLSTVIIFSGALIRLDTVVTKGNRKWEMIIRLEMIIITPHACARDKAIGLSVCRRHRRCQHENRQISRSRHLCVL